MADRKLALQVTMGDEGFYSNDHTDSGGETVYGVARTKHPNAKLWALVDHYRTLPGFPGNMKGKADILVAADDVYGPGFFTPIRFDEIINQEAATALFNDAVNRGPVPAIKSVQETLSIPQTGSMDNHTLSELNRVNNYA